MIDEELIGAFHAFVCDIGQAECQAFHGEMRKPFECGVLNGKVFDADDFVEKTVSIFRNLPVVGLDDSRFKVMKPEVMTNSIQQGVMPDGIDAVPRETLFVQCSQ